MAKKMDYPRVRIKRSTISGVVPTIPTSPKDPLDHTINQNTTSGWTTTDLYVGEMFMNTADDKLWFRSDNGINLIQYSGSTPTFIDLSDTPSTYTSNSSKYLQVNSGETGLEFVSKPTYTFEELTDTTNYVANKYLRVDSSATYLEYVDVNTSFSGLTDVPDYSGYSGYTVQVNSGETGVEYSYLPYTLVTLNTEQTINSAKTFAAHATFSTGLTIGTDAIYDIITVTGLTGSSDYNVPSTAAIKGYIDNASAVSGYTNLVHTDIDETIESVKTYTQDGKYSGGNIQMLGTAVYFGTPQTDGGYRMYVNPSAELEIGKYDAASSAYTYVTAFSSLKTPSLQFATGGTDTTGHIVTGITNDSGLTDEDYRIVTESAIKAYVDAQVGSADTLAEVLALGNTTDGNDINLSVNDDKLIIGEDSAYLTHDSADDYITLNNGNAGSFSLQDGASSHKVSLDTSLLGASRVQQFPDKDGVFAMVDDLSGVTLANVLDADNSSDGRDIDTSDGSMVVGDTTLSSMDGIRNMMIGGQANTIDSTTSLSTVVGSKSSTITSGELSSILDGFQNSMSGTTECTIVGGRTNTISECSRSAIVGGIDNTITSGDTCSIICGDNNTISTLIPGGTSKSVIVGSRQSYTQGIVSGVYTSDFSSATSAKATVISGSYSHCSGSTSIIAGSAYSTITGTNNYNGIIGGYGNHIDASFGCIIAGSGNTVSHNNSVCIGGEGLTSVATDTVYVPNLEIDTQSVNALIIKDVVDGTRYQLYVSGGTFTIATA